MNYRNILLTANARDILEGQECREHCSIIQYQMVMLFLGAVGEVAGITESWDDV